MGSVTPSNADLALGRPWCIAGGWAACPQLANDQDVWIFVHSQSDDDEHVFDFLGAQRANMLTMFPAITPESSLMGAGAGDDTVYGDLGIGIIKVGRLGYRHVLLTDAQDIPMLLSSFDISTHQCAITSDMVFIAGPQWTSIYVYPHILRDTGEKTRERVQKITQRYMPRQFTATAETVQTMA